MRWIQDAIFFDPPWQQQAEQLYLFSFRHSTQIDEGLRYSIARRNAKLRVVRKIHPALDENSALDACERALDQTAQFLDCFHEHLRHFRMLKQFDGFHPGQWSKGPH